MSRDSFFDRVARRALALDRALLAVSARVTSAVLVATVALMVWTSLPNVPRQWVDFRNVPWLAHVTQRYDTYGTDTLSDMYGAEVILHDVADMYTRTGLEQTPQESAVWTKWEAAPYPPVVLLAEAGLYALGDRAGIGFYGAILGCAIVFLAASLLYAVRTRWYVFPLLYLNFGYFSERFVHVQDDTYLVMLVVIMAALWLARAGSGAASNVLVAVAITMKLSGLYYLKNVFTMRRGTAFAFVAIVVAGLVAPHFVWDNYLYIYRYGNELKGHWYDAVGALVLAAPFALVLWYVETRLGFDLEDLIGWGLVPFALFLAFKMNTPRHLLIVLLVPDKRVLRNLAAALALAVPAFVPGVRFGSAGPIAAAALIGALLFYLNRIGWDQVRRDLRRPTATLKLLFSLQNRTPVL